MKKKTESQPHAASIQAGSPGQQQQQQPWPPLPWPTRWPWHHLEAAVIVPLSDTRTIVAEQDEQKKIAAHLTARQNQICLLQRSTSATADAITVATHEAAFVSLQAAAAAQTAKGVGDMSLGLALSPAVAELHSSSTASAAADAAEASADAGEALAAATAVAAAAALYKSSSGQCTQRAASDVNSSDNSRAMCRQCSSGAPTEAALLARISRLQHSSLALFSASPPVSL